MEEVVDLGKELLLVDVVILGVVLYYYALFEAAVLSHQAVIVDLSGANRSCVLTQLYLWLRDELFLFRQEIVLP